MDDADDDEDVEIKREAAKVRLEAMNQQCRDLKLLLHGRFDVGVVRQLRALKADRRRLQRELGGLRAILTRGEMTYSGAFLQVAKRLLPTPVFRELRLATCDFREIERDGDVEDMLLERREYVEAAIRGVKY